jgi:acetyltransferase-like isoleucine patch superfamily enzyme
MNGRALFGYIRYFAYSVSSIMRFIPNFVLFFVWDIVSIFENRPAVLMRYCIIRAKAKKCGDNVFLGKNVTIKCIESLELGDNVSIHNNCYIDASGGIRIRDNVSIAHNSTILSSTHTWADSKVAIKYNIPDFHMTTIDSNVWIGCGVRIMAGIKISENTIVGAGSVCTKSLASGAVYGGIPARMIKSI